MKTIKRENIHVGTALSSASNRMQSAARALPEDTRLTDDLPVEPQPVLARDLHVEPHPASEKPYIQGASFRARIKRALRFIAKHAYRCLKPLTKPVAFRIRQYFLAGFADFNDKFVNISAATTNSHRNDTLKTRSSGASGHLYCSRGYLYRSDPTNGRETNRSIHPRPARNI